MDPNHPDFIYQNSQNHPNSQDSANFAEYMNPSIFPNFENEPNSQFYTQLSPNLAQVPTSQRIPTSENISRNLFQGVQHPKQNRKGTKNVNWCVKEDLALMSAWVYVSEDKIKGKNQKGDSFWARVHTLYHKSRAENPGELNDRNIESMKCRQKRLNENANKWVAACREANTRRRSGMSDNDVEKEAHAIYEEGGNKFQDLFVFNEVMCKCPKWRIHDTTQVMPESEDVENLESGGSSKRSKTSEDGGFSIPFNAETPNSEHSIGSSRPTGRDKAKRKGKGKVSQSESTNESIVAAEIREMRLSKDTEAELIKSRMELDREKMQRSAMKMREKMLLQLMAKDHLSPEDEEMKRQLMKIVFG